MKYTVTWEQAALSELAKLWCDNPNLHGEIQKASDEIDRVLLRNPHRFDVLYHEYVRVGGATSRRALSRIRRRLARESAGDQAGTTQSLMDRA
jgi:hypothetical protein